MTSEAEFLYTSECLDEWSVYSGEIERVLCKYGPG